jgi:uncharacterized protein YoxC
MDSTSLNTIMNITQIVLYLSLIILAVYLIIFLKKFLKSITKIENEVVEISDQLSPVISDLKYVTEDIKILVDTSRLQMEKIVNLSETYVEKGRKLLNLINKAQHSGQGIIFNASNMLCAINKGFNTFKNKLSHR